MIIENLREIIMEDEEEEQNHGISYFGLLDGKSIQCHKNWCPL